MGLNNKFCNFQARTDAVLETASRIAKNEYKTVKKLHTSIKLNFSSFEKEMNKMEKELLLIGDKHKALSDSLKTILEVRRNGVKECWKEWEGLFTKRKSDLDFFSIMLFGRTMSGKSTTLEALAGGDGSRIGPGVPDFTRDLDSVIAGRLRIVDTPGIEGFSKDIVCQAEEFMDRADIIAFIMSDDHIEPALLEKMVSILNRRKPLVILLNIKVGKIQRFIRNPSSVFRDNELDGHKRRIRGFLRKSLEEAKLFIDIESIPIIEYCAEAANIARNDNRYNKETSDNLFELSRIKEFTDVITRMIIERGASIRALAAYESFMVNLEEIEDGLRMELAQVNGQMRTLNQSISGVSRLFDEIHNSGSQQIAEMRDHFYGVEARLDSFVDSVFNDDFKNPQKEFKKLVNLKYVQKECDEFNRRFRSQLIDKVNEFQRRINVDLKLSADIAFKEISFDTAIDSDEVDWAKTKKVIGKWGKIVGAPVAGSVTAAATAWAVTNFWNPSGWIAAGIAIVAGGVATMATGAISEAVQVSGKKDIVKARKNLRKKLKKQIRDTCEKKVIEPMNIWTKSVVQDAQHNVVEGLSLFGREIEAFLAVGGEFVSEISDIRCEAATASLNAIMPIAVPESAQREILHTRTVRRVGYKTNIAVSGINESNGIGHLIGKKGCTIKKLSDLLGGEMISAVPFDGGQITEESVCHALKPAELSDVEMQFSTDSSLSQSVVQLSGLSDEQIRKASGKHRWNQRLAESLFGCRIFLSK